MKDQGRDVMDMPVRAAGALMAKVRRGGIQGAAVADPVDWGIVSNVCLAGGKVTWSKKTCQRSAGRERCKAKMLRRIPDWDFERSRPTRLRGWSEALGVGLFHNMAAAAGAEGTHCKLVAAPCILVVHTEDLESKGHWG